MYEMIIEIKQDEADLFLLAMLANNRPFFLLPYQIREGERGFTLSYDLDGKQPLSALLKETLTLEQALDIMEQVLQALIELESYFIFQPSLDADPDHIFYEEKKMFFVCRPLRSCSSGNQPVQKTGEEESLKVLKRPVVLTALTKAMTEMLSEADQASFLSIKKKLTSSSFPLEELQVLVQNELRRFRNKVDQVDYYASLPESPSSAR